MLDTVDESCQTRCRVFPALVVIFTSWECPEFQVNRLRCDQVWAFNDVNANPKTKTPINIIFFFIFSTPLDLFFQRLPPNLLWLRWSNHNIQKFIFLTFFLLEFRNFFLEFGYGILLGSDHQRRNSNALNLPEIPNSLGPCKLSSGRFIESLFRKKSQSYQEYRHSKLCG